MFQFQSVVTVIHRRKARLKFVRSLKTRVKTAPIRPQSQTNHNLRIIKDSFLWDERSGSTIQLHMVHQFRRRDEPLWERFYWFV